MSPIPFCIGDAKKSFRFTAVTNVTTSHQVIHTRARMRAHAHLWPVIGYVGYKLPKSLIRRVTNIGYTSNRHW